MYHSFFALTIALLVTVLLFSPQQARADYPFFVTNNFGRAVDFRCHGPWGRTSQLGGEINTPKGIQHSHFYTAEETIFSPLGEWTCGHDFSCVKTCRLRGVDFCLVDRGGNHNVELTVDSSGRVSVNMPPCGGAAAAGQTSVAVAEVAGFLGSLAGTLGEAGFRLSGTAGDKVTITFATDGSKGGEGEIAELSVRSVPGAVLDERKGTMPITLSVALPTTGSVEIDATQVTDFAAGSHHPFRGFYQLTVTSSLGEAVKLAPRPSTEP